MNRRRLPASCLAKTKNGDNCKGYKWKHHPEGLPYCYGHRNYHLELEYKAKHQPNGRANRRVGPVTIDSLIAELESKAAYLYNLRTLASTERKRVFNALSFDEEFSRCFACFQPVRYDSVDRERVRRDPNEVSAYELGHVIPRARGGQMTWNNLCVLCIECNRAMRDTPLDEYMHALYWTKHQGPYDHSSHLRDYLVKLATDELAATASEDNDGLVDVFRGFVLEPLGRPRCGHPTTAPDRHPCKKFADTCPHHRHLQQTLPHHRQQESA